MLDKIGLSKGLVSQKHPRVCINSMEIDTVSSVCTWRKNLLILQNAVS